MFKFLNTGLMKRILFSKVRETFSLIIFVALFSILGSCQKNTELDNPGGNPGGTPGPGTNEVFISGSAFTPSSITVAANTTITWTNKDSAPHTVTSNSGAFNSGTINANGTFSHTFTVAGTYPYHCALHASMTASVIAN